MGSVLNIVQNYISNRVDQADTNLLAINPLDSSKTIVIAKRQTYRNLGKKVNHKDVNNFFEETSKTLGRNYTNKPVNTDTQLPSPSLQFEATEVINNLDVEGDVEEDMEVWQKVVNTRRKSRQNLPDATSATMNTPNKIKK